MTLAQRVPRIGAARLWTSARVCSAPQISTPSTAAASDEDSAALGRFFYRNRMVEQWAKVPAKRTTLRQLILFGQSARRNRALLMESANYLRTELTTRIAHRLRDMQTLPFVAMSNEQLDSIYQYYWSTFETLRRMEKIQTLEQNEELIKVVTQLLSERKSKLSLIAGISRECVHYMEPETVDLFLARMLRSQVSREVLAKQHIALSVMQSSGKESRTSTKIGMIDTHLSVLQAIEKSVTIARQSIAQLYNWTVDDARIPNVVIEGDTDVHIAYLPAHLEFILLELCKVSMQSTMRHYKTDGEATPNQPDVRLTIVEGPDRGDMTIRISDRGGGLTANAAPDRSQAENLATRARGPIMLAGSDEAGHAHDESGLVWSFMNIGEQLDKMNIQLEQTSTSEHDANLIDGAVTPDPTVSYPGGDGLMRLSVLSMESKNGLPMCVVMLTQRQSLRGALWRRPGFPDTRRVRSATHTAMARTFICAFPRYAARLTQFGTSKELHE